MTLERLYREAGGDLAGTVARLGGEEFAVLMPSTPLTDAAQAAERLRIALQDTPIALGSGQVVNITASLGLAQWEASDPDIDAPLQRADAALYRAKATGRNRLCTEPDAQD